MYGFGRRTIKIRKSSRIPGLAVDSVSCGGTYSILKSFLAAEGNSFGQLVE